MLVFKILNSILLINASFSISHTKTKKFLSISSIFLFYVIYPSNITFTAILIHSDTFFTNNKNLFLLFQFFFPDMLHPTLNSFCSSGFKCIR
ncbi:hypothetical protein LMOh7858_0342 [Listeria monocytogenes str. 4b H7858]|nr:hypothetical protein LMOh7858_0342 [Listeria monocytogenes str. 4b H7858] [Listeria monocytogenes serotype 4b str. H7858]